MTQERPDPAAAGPPADPADPADPDARTAFDIPTTIGAPVETDLIEAPVVRLAGDEPGPRRIGRAAVAVVAAVGLLAIGATIAWGALLNQDLAAARATLATTESSLATTSTTLEATTGDLAAASASLATTTAEREALDAKVEGLAAQVAGQTACVARQTAALAELARISDLQTANFNRTAENSTWARAEAKRDRAIDDALDAYYQAYSRAFQGSTAAARASAANGKAAEAAIASQETQQAAELALIDRSAAEISGALDALEQELAATETTCREVAP